MSNLLHDLADAFLGLGTSTPSFWLRKTLRRRELRAVYAVPEPVASPPADVQKFARAVTEVAVAIAPSLLELDAAVAASTVHDCWPEGRRHRRLGEVEVLDSEVRGTVASFLERWQEETPAAHLDQLHHIREALLRESEPPSNEQAFDTVARLRRLAARWRGIFLTFQTMLLELHTAEAGA